MREPLGLLPATRLLVRLRLQRLHSRLGVALRRGARKPQLGSRQATPGKSKQGWLLSALVAFAMLFGFGSNAQRVLQAIESELGTALVASSLPTSSATDAADMPTPRQRHRAALREHREPLAAAAGSRMAPGVLRGIGLELALLLLAAVLLNLASKEWTKPEWDLEWLVTMPVPLATLLAARVLERTVASPTTWILFWPFLSFVAWNQGLRLAAPLLGAGFTLVLGALVAVVQTIVDTGLRSALSPPRLRNLQALISVTSVVAIVVVMAPAFPSGEFFYRGVALVPDWSRWTPPLLTAHLLSGTDRALLARDLSLLLAWLFAVVLGGVTLIAWQLRAGVVAAGARESARAPSSQPGLAPVKARRWLTPIQARELRLLSRDRNFLVQTLVVPVVAVGAQFFLQSRGASDAVTGWAPVHLAAIAFAIAAYALMFSALQNLNAEGQALWILYTVRHPLERVLWQKALLWSVLVLVYPVVILGFGFASAGPFTTEKLGLVALVLAGVPLYALIGTALGVFACDPLSVEAQQRVRPSYLYLYLLLSSLYVYAIYATSFWQRLALLVLTATLALALWQKARDHLPFLLDPTASPPPRVALADGLIAAMLFFVVQGLCGILLAAGDPQLSGSQIFVAFGIAGATTYILTRYTYWRTKTTDLPRIFGERLGRSLAWGLGAGAVAIAVGASYLALLARIDLGEEVVSQVQVDATGLRTWFFALAVLAAPLFEEFIFRGLILGGLRRSLPLWAAVLASAALFAIVHPPVSVFPVFCLGILTGLAYVRTGSLLAPMLVHALYNSAVLGLQWSQ